MPITHAFTSTKSEGSDPTKVRTSDWNADHTLTADYVGNNTAYSSVVSNERRQWVVPFTTTTAGLLVSVQAHMSSNGTNVGGIAAALFDDNGGTPLLIGASGHGQSNVTGFALSSTYRWAGLPIGIFIPAGDYWLAWMYDRGGSGGIMNLHYDASGTGYYVDPGGSWINETAMSSPTSTTATWSIRGLMIY